LTDCTVRRDTSGTRDTVKVPVDISHLQLAANATGGLFFPGSTPQTIVATFDSIMHLYSSPPPTRAGYKPTHGGTRRISDSPIAFDVSGRILEKCASPLSRNAALDFRGIYFVKYRDGRIERRMNLPKYGNSGR
jgi:hypothetical protein